MNRRSKTYALRTGRVVTHNARSIYEVPGQSARLHSEFLSSTRIALAGGPDSESFLPASTPSPVDPTMQARINRVAGAPIFAVARTGPPPAPILRMCSAQFPAVSEPGA